jgi:hypothetical protein
MNHPLPSHVFEEGFGCTNCGLFSQEISGNEQGIRRPFTEPAHKIGIPFRTKRNVDTHPPTLAH